MASPDTIILLIVWTTMQPLGQDPPCPHPLRTPLLSSINFATPVATAELRALLSAILVRPIISTVVDTSTETSKTGFFRSETRDTSVRVPCVH